MCLDIKYPQANIRKLPKEFTADKVVRKVGDEYYPPIRPGKEVKAMNRIATFDIWDKATDGKKYKPYFHCFRTKAACRAVENCCKEEHWHYLKIRIKRKDVTCIGGQGKKRIRPPYFQTIVTKAFTTDFERVEI